MQRPSLATAAVAWAFYIFLIAPSLIVIPMSFNNSSELVFPPRVLSLRLYREFIYGGDWLSATWQSFIVAFATTILSVLAGVPAAYALTRAHFPGRRLLGMVLLAPMLVPTIVIGLGLYMYLASFGLNGTTLGLILGHTILTTPFVIVIAMASLRHLDANLEVAAKVMGAGQLTVFRRIVLPLLAPAIGAAALFAFLISFDEVVVAYFISGVGTTTLPVKMYSAIHWEVSPVLPVVSTLLTGLSLVVCVLGSILQPKEQGSG
ncbi:MAG: ABC transporter permease [Alphaproteobacteria bacterium]|nr:ABC transporter permease [Alphaproteobacteria bacterium]